MAVREFPSGFLWGSNIAAHHSEGKNTNTDWWEDEQARRSISEPSGSAADSYHRFAEDWQLAAGTGQNAIRFSIEWSRIEPSPGEFSSVALDHYREVIGAANDLGLTSVVSLHHFTNPLWFARAGAWTQDESVELFERYARRVGTALGDLMPVANPINEPQSIVQGRVPLRDRSPAQERREPGPPGDGEPDQVTRGGGPRDPGDHVRSCRPLHGHHPLRAGRRRSRAATGRRLLPPIDGRRLPAGHLLWTDHRPPRAGSRGARAGRHDRLPGGPVLLHVRRRFRRAGSSRVRNDRQ